MIRATKNDWNTFSSQIYAFSDCGANILRNTPYSKDQVTVLSEVCEVFNQKAISLPQI